MGMSAPALDASLEPLVGSVVEVELVLSEPREVAKHVSEDRWGEAAVLLSCKPAESVKAVARLNCREVHEVACLGSAEDGENLVDGELLAAEHRGRRSGLGRKESRVGGEVELCAVVRALNDKAGEAGVLLNVMDDEPGVAKCAIGGREEAIDRGGC
jgi:hypothetical protein